MKTAISIVLLIIGGMLLFYYFQILKPETANPVQFSWQYSQQDIVYYFDTTKLTFAQDNSAITLTDNNNSMISIGKQNSAQTQSAASSFFAAWATAGSNTMTVPNNCKYLTLTVHYPRTATSKLEDDIEQISCQNTLPADKQLDTFQDSDLPPYDQTGI